jgi:Fe-S cluster biogenesis protein NfuA
MPSVDQAAVNVSDAGALTHDPAAPLSAAGESVARVCREVLAALIEADGGRMFLVSASADDIHIHLAGTCAGCPGSAHTTSRILAPTLERVLPKAKLRVTTGWIVPESAVRLAAV